MEESYKCSKCETWTVSCDLGWGVPGNSYDEIMYEVFYCSKCGSEFSQPLRDKDTKYEEGDTVLF